MPATIDASDTSRNLVKTTSLTPLLANRLADPNDPASWVRDFEDREGMAEANAEAEHRGFHIAAQILAEIGRRLLDHSTHSAAVALALGLHETDGGSFAEIGQRHGVSKQACFKAAQNLRRIFSAGAMPHSNQARLVRPSEPGRWLTRVEVAKEFGATAVTASGWGCRTVDVGIYKFWDGDHLSQLKAERAEAEAERRLRRHERKQFLAEQKLNQPKETNNES